MKIQITAVSKEARGEKTVVCQVWFKLYKVRPAQQRRKKQGKMPSDRQCKHSSSSSSTPTADDTGENILNELLLYLLAAYGIFYWGWHTQYSVNEMNLDPYFCGYK